MLSTIFLLPLLLLVSFTGAHTKNPKRGIGFASSVPGDIINANQTNSVISWQYNWATLPPDYLATSNIAYIPMQWGSVGVDSFSSSVKILGSNTILAFNEPDNINEANMLPEEAASLWMQFLEPLKSQGIRLGGPAVTAAGSGRPWLTSFLSACSNCTIDFLPVHWYGSGFEGFAAYLGDVHNAFPKYPLWVTEYAETSNNDTEVLTFMNQTLTFLDGLDWVERYAWFGFFRPSSPDVHYGMLRDDGGLNALGELYLGAKTVHTENATSAPTTTLNTVNGADNPTQLPATTWAPLNGSAQRTSGSVARLWLLGLTFVSGLFGVASVTW